MKTKKIALLIAFLPFAFLQVSAQNFQSTERQTTKANPPELQKKESATRMSSQDILEMKRDYIEENLQLTEQEARLFWNLYDRVEEAEMAIHKKYRVISQNEGIESTRNKFDYTGLSDERILYMMEKRLEMQTEMLELEKNYFNELKTILPPQKIVKLDALEKKFKREIVRKNDSRRQEKK